MNMNAKEYVPRQNPKTDKSDSIRFNLNANEYVPKKSFQTPQQSNYYANSNQNNQPTNFPNNYSKNYNEQISENFQNMSVSQNQKKNTPSKVIEEHMGDESDEESWYPKYKDCECCQGFVYKCKGDACSHLKFCVCKIQEECDL